MDERQPKRGLQATITRSKGLCCHGMSAVKGLHSGHEVTRPFSECWKIDAGQLLGSRRDVAPPDIAPRQHRCPLRVGGTRPSRKPIVHRCHLLDRD